MKCGTAKCKNEARYFIVSDYVYDGDHQLVLWATEWYECEEHARQLIRTLKRASKEYEVKDLTSGREKVEFT